MTLTSTPALAKPVGSTRHGDAVRAARRRAALHWVAVHSMALAAALFFLLPFVFVFLTSVMTDRQALTSDFWPQHWQWSNYAKVWQTPAS